MTKDIFDFFVINERGEKYIYFAWGKKVWKILTGHIDKFRFFMNDTFQHEEDFIKNFTERKIKDKKGFFFRNNWEIALVPVNQECSWMTPLPWCFISKRLYIKRITAVNHMGKSSVQHHNEMVNYNSVNMRDC